MNRTSTIMLSLALVLCHPGSRAQTGAELAGTLAVSTIIDDIRQSIIEITDRLATEGSLLSFDVRSDLIIASENLSRLAMEFEGKTFSDLNKLEQKTFADLRATLADFNAGNSQSLEDLDRSISTFGVELSRLPGVSDTPLVTSARPSHFVSGGDGSVVVVLRGSALGRSTAVLQFNQSACATVGATELDLRFRCDAASVWKPDDAWGIGQVSILRESPWWKFWSSDTRVDYAVGIRRIDPQLGRLNATAQVERKVEQRNDRSDERIVRTGPCGRDSQVWRFEPASGCSIDVDSIQAEQGPVSSRSQYHGVQGANSSGFTIRGEARGSGDRVFGRCVGGGAGVVIARAKWVDVCTTQSVAAVQVASDLPILWGSDVKLDLPPSNQGFSVSVLQANGQEKVFVGTAESDWLSVLHDAVGNTVVVKPKALEDAMR